MTWFRVDDKLHDHRKSRRAGVEAMGLWVLAGSWASDNLTEGFVPTVVLTRWHARPERIAAKLIEAGLWEEAEEAGEAGYRFHQWSDHQPTRAEVEDRRAKRAAAGRAGGQASARARAQASAAAVVEAPSNEPATPTRPDPTRTGSNEPVRGAAASQRPRGTRLPEDWEPGVAEIDYAREHRLDPKRTAADFRDYWTAKAGKDAVKVNWTATWQKWCRTEADRQNVRHLPRAASNGFDINSVPIHERWRYQ